MKKQYIQPELEAIDIKVNTILCASLGVADTTLDADEALGREFELDFEEETMLEFEEDEDIAY